MAGAGWWVEGESFAWEDFTFREMREVEQLIREMGDDPNDPADATFIPACVTVIMRRKIASPQPDYSVERAMDLKITDLVRPTKPAPKKKQAASAADDSGIQTP